MFNINAAAAVIGSCALLGTGGCVSLPPPILATENRSQPLMIEALSDRIQCELASVYRLPRDRSGDMDNFAGAIDLELKVVERLQAGAGGGLAVAFSGGRITPSIGVTGSRDATRSGQIRFNVKFKELRTNPCAHGDGFVLASTGWPEAAGSLGLGSWLSTAVSAVARPTPDRAGLVQLDYTLQFDVLVEATGGFKIAPVNVTAEVGGGGKSQTTNRLVVAIRRIPPEPTAQLVEIVNWGGRTAGLRRRQIQAAPGAAARATSLPPTVERLLDQQLRDSINRVTPQLLRTSPFIN